MPGQMHQPTLLRTTPELPQHASPTVSPPPFPMMKKNAGMQALYFCFGDFLICNEISFYIVSYILSKE